MCVKDASHSLGSLLLSMTMKCPQFRVKWIRNWLGDLDITDDIALLNHTCVEMANNIYVNGAMVGLRINYKKTKQAMSDGDRADVSRCARVHRELPLSLTLHIHGGRLRRCF